MSLTSASSAGEPALRPARGGAEVPLFDGSVFNWPVFKHRFILFLTLQKMLHVLADVIYNKVSGAAGEAAASRAGADAERLGAQESGASSSSDGASAEKEKETKKETKEKETKKETKPDDEKLRSDKMTVRAWIGMALGSVQLIQLLARVPMDDPVGAWRKLVERYESKTLATKSHVFKSFLGARMASIDEPVDVFAARVDDLGATLESMGEAVATEAMRCFMLLGGVPDAWDAIREALKREVEEGRIGFHRCVNRLVQYQEEQKLREQQQQQLDEVMQAMVLRDGKKKKNFSKPGGQTGQQQGAASSQGVSSRSDGPTCFECKKPGHMARRCPNKKCWSCGLKGHIVTACPTLKLAYRPNDGGMLAAAADDDDEELDYACITMELVQCGRVRPDVALCALLLSYDWTIDSAATRHLSNNP